MNSIRTYLMFVGDQCGKAEEAIGLYVSLFARSEVQSIEHYSARDAPEQEGAVKSASFTLSGSPFMAMDSALNHAFAFTPAISMYVECESLEEIENAYRMLSDGGEELMPIGNHGFSKMFGWTNDKYGISWQLNLA